MGGARFGDDDGHPAQLRQQSPAATVASDDTIGALGSRPLEAVARLACEADPAMVEDGGWRDLLAAIGVTGIEVRRSGAAERVWWWGDGRPGEPVCRGPLVVTPRGGTPRPSALWRLLIGLLTMLFSGVDSSGSSDGEVQIDGESASACRLRDEIRRLARTDLSVLLVGETGTGKERLARSTHGLSERRGSFVPVNVAAIPFDLLEAELFGSVRGAYTGADRARTGLVRAAHGGTLFLDEIGDLDVAMQAKLLRILESGEVRPVGSTTFHRVDVRVVSATHRDLESLVVRGAFRKDLYYRLAQAVVRVPPLRERIDDLPLLRALFADGAAHRLGLRPCRWSEAAEIALAEYQWPGNVRELRHVVERAMVEAAGGVVGSAMLPISRGTPPRPRRWHQEMAAFRRRLLTAALGRNGGNRSAAARELGISRQTLLYHLRSLGLGGPDATKKGADREVRRRKEEV